MLHAMAVESSTESSTVVLLRAAQQGRAEALQELLRRHRDALLARIRLMMGPEARAAAESEDFVQGVFLEVARDLNRFSPVDERSFLRWATHIARNNIRDEVRRRRETALGSLASSVVPVRSAHATGPLGEAMRHEQIEVVVSALLGMPDDHRLVIELRDFDGRSFAEIGETMGRSENAAQLLHASAMIRLGAILVHHRSSPRG